MSDIAVVFAIVLAVVVLFVWNRIPVVLVAIGMPFALYLTGTLSASEAMAGVPALIGIMAIVLLLGHRVLPKRNGSSLPADFSAHTQTLVEQYYIEDGLHRLRVRSTSPYIGARGGDVDLTDYPGLSLVAIQDGDSRRPLPWRALAEGDVILVRGDAEVAGRLATDKHLAFLAEDGTGGVAATLFNRRSGLAEVVIPPRSPLVGRAVFPGMVTSDGELVVLALQRSGEDLGARSVLMSITVAAAASFLTPVATPPNLMVMGPGGYRFGDYWKLGLPCMVWFFVVAVFLVPLYWKF